MSSHVTGLFERATGHHKAGRLQEAEKDYLSLIESNDRNTDALRLLAALYVQAGDFTKAIVFFEKAHHLEPKNAEITTNLGVAYSRLGNLGKATACYEKALEGDPRYQPAVKNLAAAYYDQGNLLISQGERVSAGVWFERALKVDKKHFRALNNLGSIERTQGRFEKAQQAFERAIAINPHYLEAHINLGNILRDRGEMEAAEGSYRQALALKAFSVEALNNLGTLMQDLNRLDEALSFYDEALRLLPDSHLLKSNKAFALLAKGEFKEGWRLHESGLGLLERRGLCPFKAKPWDGSGFKGKLLIWSEQGFGDCIQFVRYAALCKRRGGEVWVQAPEALRKLFSSAIGVDGVIVQPVEEDFDHHVMMMSLPFIFETEISTIPATIPYFRVADEEAQRWEVRLGAHDKFRIGLVWAGASRKGNLDAELIDARRSVTLPLLAPILDVAGISFYSLQLGAPAQQIKDCGHTDKIIDWTGDLIDFSTTAAFISRLDLIISVDTAVAHLAGSLGKEVWILSRTDGCWRWLGNQKLNPWYPSARIFGQTLRGDWTNAVAALVQSLTDRLESKRRIV